MIQPFPRGRTTLRFLALPLLAGAARADGTTIQVPPASVVANATIEAVSGDWDELGREVAADGDLVAFSGNGPAGEPGVFLFERQAGTFVQVDLLGESDLGGFDPADLGLSGDTLTVLSSMGFAVELRVFRWDGSDLLLEIALTAGDLGIAPADQDVSGDTLAVIGSSQVVTWVRSGASWSPEAVVPLANSIGDGVIDLDGDLLVVGGSSFQDNYAFFERTGSTWGLQQMLTVGANPARVALDGMHAVVAEGFSPVQNVLYYESMFGTWTLVDIVPISDQVDSLDLEGDLLSVISVHSSTILFGFRLAGTDWILEFGETIPNIPSPECGIVGGTVVAPAFSSLEVGFAAFSETGGVWSAGPLFEVQSIGLGGDFGHAADVDGARAVVGAPLGGLHPGGVAGPTTGLAAVHAFDGVDWVLESVLSAPGGADGDQFGFDVAIDGDRALVGAPAAAAASGSGRAFVFHDDGSGWQLETELLPFDEVGHAFGHAVDLDGARAVVGAADPGEVGSAYTYELVAGTWQPRDALLAPASQVGDRFGFDVALDGDHLAVSARELTVAAYLETGGTWTLEQALDAPAGAAGWGWSIALDAPRLAIGAPNAEPAPFSGLVSIYERGPGGGWLLEDSFFHATGDEHLGLGVALEGDLCAAAFREEFPGFGDRQDGFWVYQRHGSGWKEQQVYSESFGNFRPESLDLDGSRVAIGRPEAAGTQNTGSPGEVPVFALDHQPATFCWGDGAEGACPCGNEGVAGAGCQTSAGQGARLASTGSTSVAAGDLTLVVSDLPPNKVGLFFAGQQPVAATLGDGLLCVVPQVRGQVMFGGPAGTFSQTDFASTIGAVPGDRWTVQTWFRDPPGPCGAGTNTSNGLLVTFTP